MQNDFLSKSPDLCSVYSYACCFSEILASPTFNLSLPDSLISSQAFLLLWLILILPIWWQSCNVLYRLYRPNFVKFILHNKTNVRSNARLVTFMVPVFQINWLRTWPELGQQSGHDKKPEGQKQDCVIDINWYEILSVHYFRIATQCLFGGYNCAVRTLYRIKCTFFVLNPEKFGIKTYKLTLI